MNNEQPIKIKINDFKRQRTEKIGSIDDFLKQKQSEIENYNNPEKPAAGDKPPRSSGGKTADEKSIWMKVGKLPLYLLIFLLPLFFLPLTIAPVEINKQVLASLLVLISFICYLASSIESRKIVYHRSLLGLAVLVLLLATAASAFSSQAKFVSIFGNLTQSDSLLSFAVYGLTFYLARVFFQKKDLGKIGVIFLASLVLTAVLGLLQLLGFFIYPFISPSLDFTRQTSFNSLGSVLSWGIFIAFGLVLIVSALVNLRLSLIYKIVLAVIALFIAAELIVVNYSFLWLAITFSMLILMAYCFTTQKKIGIPLAAVIVSLFFALASPSLPSLVKITPEIRPSFSSTLEIAKETLWPKAGKSQIENGKNVLLGSGPATFAYDYTFYRSADLNQTNFWQARFTQGSSFITTLLATGGILGILALLFLIFSFVRQACLSGRQALRGLENKRVQDFEPQRVQDFEPLPIALGILFLIAALAFYPSFLTQFVFIFLGLGLLAPDSSMREISLLNVSRPRAFLAFIALITVVVGSMFLSYLVGQKYAAAFYYQKGVLTYNQGGDLARSLADLERASALDPACDQYLRATSQILLLDVQNLAAKNLLSDTNSRIQNEIAQAVELAKKATDINPIDSLNWSNLAGVYEEIIPFAVGSDVFAEKNYRRAMEQDPKNPELAMGLARVLITCADQNKAKDENVWRQKLNEANGVLEKAISLKSDYTPAHFQVAMIYIREGKTQEAIDKLEAVKNLAPYDSSVFFQLGTIYYNNNQLDKAQKELEKAIALAPNYSNARYVLGLIYDKNGQKDKAIEQFEEVLKLNPDNEDVKAILNNLKSGGSALKGTVLPLEEKTGVPLPGEGESKKAP